MSREAGPTANDRDRTSHDALNALAAARAQVDLARRRLARRGSPESVERSLAAALRSLDKLAALLGAAGSAAPPAGRDDVVAGRPARPGDAEPPARLREGRTGDKPTE